MPLTKSALANILCDTLGLTKRESKRVVETFYEEISLALETGDSVNLAGFGNFNGAAFQPSAKLKALTRGRK